MMKGTIQSQPLLLVQSTGGGKLAVPQTCGSAVPGVTIVIENTLALYADQVSKFDKVEAEGSHIFTIQLDRFKSRSKRQYVIDTINLFIDRSNTNQPLNASIFIFASPERLVSDDWLPTIQNIVNNKCLSLLCVDEVHQFVEYGTTFRTTFRTIKDLLLIPMLVQSTSTMQNNKFINTTVPILFMSATMNKSILSQLESMLWIQFEAPNIYWISMQHL